jgi:hypothetical protein
VTAFNAAGDEDDVWPSLSPRPSPCASPFPHAYGGDKPHEGGRQLSPYGPSAARATEERKDKIPKNKTDSVFSIQQGSNIEKQTNQEEIQTNRDSGNVLKESRAQQSSDQVNYKDISIIDNVTGDKPSHLGIEMSVVIAGSELGSGVAAEKQ